jgi:hypothetical protein
MPDNKQNKITNGATKLIADAVREALKTIADEARDAKHLVASDAENAAKLLAVKNSDGSSDHDTLNTLVGSVANLEKSFTEKIQDVRNDIKEIKDGTASRISKLEEEKLNAKDSYCALYKKGVDEDIKCLKDEVSSQKTTITKIWSYGVALIFLIGVVEFLLSNFLRK